MFDRFPFAVRSSNELCALSTVEASEGRSVHHRVVEHALPVGGLLGLAVVLNRARRRLGRAVTEQLEDVRLAHLVGHPLGAPPDIGERVAAPHAPHRVDQLAGRAAELGAPVEVVADEADGPGRQLRERFDQPIHLAPRDLLHVVELLLELGELTGHRPHLADLVRDLGRLVHDHLGSLDHAADVEQGVGRPCAREHQDGDQEGGGKAAVAHDELLVCHCRVPALGTRTSDVNQTRRRWPARIVRVGSRFRNRSRTEVALWPRPWPTPALRPNGEPPAKASPLTTPMAPAAANVLK